MLSAKKKQTRLKLKLRGLFCITLDDLARIKQKARRTARRAPKEVALGGTFLSPPASCDKKIRKNFSFVVVV